eukprot:scaffold110346_cov28-Phaeocystis_antarctica.AAC.1
MPPRATSRGPAVLVFGLAPGLAPGLESVATAHGGAPGAAAASSLPRGRTWLRVRVRARVRLGVRPHVAPGGGRGPLGAARPLRPPGVSPRAHQAQERVAARRCGCDGPPCHRR